MKAKLTIITLLFCLLLVGCNKVTTPNVQNPEDDLKPEEHYQKQVMRIVAVHDNNFEYVLIPEDGVDLSVNIIGDNIDGLVEEFDEIAIECEQTGANVKIEIIGEIFDFKLLNVVWDEQEKELVNSDVIKEYDEIENSSIYIKTSLPCGMANKVIEWKNTENKEFRMFISQDGYGFSGSVIWSK